MHNSILSLTLWTPEDLIIFENKEMKSFRTNEFILDIKKMERCMVGESQMCVSKSKRLFKFDKKKSLKNIVHGIRYLLFGIQIIEKGKIYNYSEANDYFNEILKLNFSRWEEYYSVYKPTYEKLKAKITNMVMVEKIIYSKYECPRNYKLSTLDFIHENTLNDLTRLYSIEYQYLNKDLIVLKSNKKYSNYNTLITNECNYLVIDKV